MTLQEYIDTLKAQPEEVRRYALLADDGRPVTGLSVVMAAGGVRLELDTRDTE